MSIRLRVVDGYVTGPRPAFHTFQGRPIGLIHDDRVRLRLLRLEAQPIDRDSQQELEATAHLDGLAGAEISLQFTDGRGYRAYAALAADSASAANELAALALFVLDHDDAADTSSIHDHPRMAGLVLLWSESGRACRDGYRARARKVVAFLGRAPSMLLPEHAAAAYRACAREVER